MLSKPYFDRRDEVPTWNADIDDATNLAVSLTARGYAAPVSVIALTPIIEQTGGSLVISNVTITPDALTFHHAGAGGRVTFRISYAAGQSEDVTVRIKMVS